MLYLFLDESGDLGFDFVQAKPSKYFVITIVAVEGMQNKKLLETAIKRTLKRKINARKNKTDELKARSTTLDVKKYAYKCTRDAQFSIYSLVVDKRSALQALAKDKSRIYNYITRQLLDQIPLHTATTRIELIIDRSKSRAEVKEFNEYIIMHLQGQISPNIPFNIYHVDSQGELVVQWADLFAWGILRKYEKNDLAWHDHFKERIRYEELFV